MKTTLDAAALGLALASALFLAGVRYGNWLSISPAQAAEEMSAEIIAVQIRDQGYACDKALSAERERSKSDDAVWVLKCENATYRVRLVPDMAAHVERLD
jgi:hypothetical protein